MAKFIARLNPIRLVIFVVFAMHGETCRGDDVRWVGTWSASPQLTEPANMPPEPEFADTTLRQVIHVSLGGRKLRVRFSNAFGTKPLTIESAHLARSAGGRAIHLEGARSLTFDGKESAVIPPGSLAISDSVDFNLAPLSDLVVTIRIHDKSESITGHPGARCHSYFHEGDWVAAPDLPKAARTPHWYYLCGVDVESAKGAAVVVLGDSITDGRGSPTDQNGRWTDYLARRLQEDWRTAGVAVLNHGLGGNRIRKDGIGPGALARLDRDVLDQPGVRWVIVLEGINDLGTRSSTARELIDAYKEIIRRAHARDIRVYGGTIMPCEGFSYSTSVLEAARIEVNGWIRESGAFDGVIDFDAATRDPGHFSRLSPAVDGGDHLHPGPKGYEIMADFVDIRHLFTFSTQ